MTHGPSSHSGGVLHSTKPKPSRPRVGSGGTTGTGGTSGSASGGAGGAHRPRRAARMPGILDAAPPAGAAAPAPDAPPVSIKYPGKASVAGEVRSDGSAVAKWPGGTMAVSVELDEVSTAEYVRSGGGAYPDDTPPRLYRVVAVHKQAKGSLRPCVTMNAFGAGDIMTAKGATVVHTCVRVCMRRGMGVEFGLGARVHTCVCHMIVCVVWMWM